MGRMSVTPTESKIFQKLGLNEKTKWHFFLLLTPVIRWFCYRNEHSSCKSFWPGWMEQNGHALRRADPSSFKYSWEFVGRMWCIQGNIYIYIYIYICVCVCVCVDVAIINLINHNLIAHQFWLRNYSQKILWSHYCKKSNKQKFLHMNFWRLSKWWLNFHFHSVRSKRGFRNEMLLCIARRRTVLLCHFHLQNWTK